MKTVDKGFGIYTGEMSNFKFEGKGVFIRNCGSVCSGEWKDGKQHGFGEIKNKPPQYEPFSKRKVFHYVGNFKCGVFQGHGTLLFVNKYNKMCSYEGEFSNGRFNGKGVFKTRGRTYKGDFVDDVFYGNGVLNIKHMRYDGIFINGRIVKGKVYKRTYRYDGFVKNGEPHGNGTCIIDYNGSREISIGNSANGKLSGLIKYKYNNGEDVLCVYQNGRVVEDKKFYKYGAIKSGHVYRIDGIIYWKTINEKFIDGVNTEKLYCPKSHKVVAYKYYIDPLVVEKFEYVYNMDSPKSVKVILTHSKRSFYCSRFIFENWNVHNSRIKNGEVEIDDTYLHSFDIPTDDIKRFLLRMFLLDVVETQSLQYTYLDLSANQIKMYLKDCYLCYTFGFMGKLLIAFSPMATCFGNASLRNMFLECLKIEGPFTGSWDKQIKSVISRLLLSVIKKRKIKLMGSEKLDNPKFYEFLDKWEVIECHDDPYFEGVENLKEIRNNENFLKVLEDETSKDLVIVSEDDKEICVHKQILLFFSDYFYRIAKFGGKEMRKDGYIILEKLSHVELQIYITIIYVLDYKFINNDQILNGFTLLIELQPYEDRIVKFHLKRTLRKKTKMMIEQKTFWGMFRRIAHLFHDKFIYGFDDDIKEFFMEEWTQVTVRSIIHYTPEVMRNVIEDSYRLSLTYPLEEEIKTLKKENHDQQDEIKTLKEEIRAAKPQKRKREFTQPELPSLKKRKKSK